MRCEKCKYLEDANKQMYAMLLCCKNLRAIVAELQNASNDSTCFAVNWNI
ncbi:hypothetical protein [Propionispira arboris]|nr:hypothetical protein [Propionispira arboris]